MELLTANIEVREIPGADPTSVLVGLYDDVHEAEKDAEMWDVWNNDLEPFARLRTTTLTVYGAEDLSEEIEDFFLADGKFRRN